VTAPAAPRGSRSKAPTASGYTLTLSETEQKHLPKVLSYAAKHLDAGPDENGNGGASEADELFAGYLRDVADKINRLPSPNGTHEHNGQQ
jgi:hypothetical protein